MKFPARLLLVYLLLVHQAMAFGPLGQFTKPFARAKAPGWIIHDRFERLTLGANWTTQSGANAAMYNSNVICIGAGPPVDPADYLIYTNHYGAGQNVRVRWRQNSLITNSGSGGVYLVFRSQSASTTRNIWMGMSASIGAGDTDHGKVKIGTSDSTLPGFTELNESLNRVTLLGGAWVDMEAERVQNQFFITASNAATGTFACTNFTFDLREAGNITPTSYHIAFLCLGGSNVIDDVMVDIPDYVPVWLLVGGKSIDDGSSATNAALRYINLLGASVRGWPTYMNAGGFNYTSNLVRTAVHGEYLMYRPYKLWFAYETDIIGGIASNTTYANYDFLSKHFRTNMVRVSMMCATPNNTANQIPHNLMMSNQYWGVPIYCGWTELRSGASSINAAYAVADMVHLNHLGHDIHYVQSRPQYISSF